MRFSKFGIRKPAAVLLCLLLVACIQPLRTEASDNAADRSLSRRADSLGLPAAWASAYQDDPLTRAEFAALAVSVYENVMGHTVRLRRLYTDTEDRNAQKMGGLGVIGSTANKTFSPNAAISREEAMVFLLNLLENMNVSLLLEPGLSAVITGEASPGEDKPAESASAAFSDFGNVSVWAVEAVSQMKRMGIAHENEKGAFLPPSALWAALPPQAKPSVFAACLPSRKICRLPL